MIQNKRFYVHLRKIGYYIFVLFIILGSILALLNRYLLKTNNEVTQGQVVEISSGGRYHPGQIWVDYTFIVNGIQCKSSTLIETIQVNQKDLEKYFVGKKFPVIYNPQFSTSYNPISDMLIFPDTFAEFKKEFPDSLKWVLQYYHPE